MNSTIIRNGLFLFILINIINCDVASKGPSGPPPFEDENNIYYEEELNINNNNNNRVKRTNKDKNKYYHHPNEFYNSNDHDYNQKHIPIYANTRSLNNNNDQCHLNIQCPSNSNFYFLLKKFEF
jgi:hypothetical protein